jgi:CRISPR-associated exonuclease Cas4
MWDGPAAQSKQQLVETMITIVGGLMDDYVLISALNQFDYCPHRCYLIHVEQVFKHNEYTIAGSIEHSRVDSGESTKRGELLQLRSVWLHSKRYRLFGKADLIEEISPGAGTKQIYPVEYKHGRRGEWKNDRLQLCAQALCLEDMLNLADPIPFGYLFYAQTARREEIKLDDELRRFCLETIESVHRLIASGERPPAIHTARCRGCSLHSVCLPRETEMLKSARHK